MSETETTENVEGVEVEEESVESRVEETVEEVEGTVEEGRERVEETVEEGLDAVNDGVVDVISAVLDTGARADVYVALRKLGEADTDEIAEETGLYPKKVEEVLEGLEDDEVVEKNFVGEDEVYEAASPTEVITNIPGRLVDRVRGLVESNGDTEEGERRVLSTSWSPYRIVIEPNEEDEEGEEIPVRT
ncbi:MAG: helix-turn-helix domain-containing protein [Halobacteriales archaeon]|nr:helix-turn-helix domain-containing protein [Halobacteriales archaeon]